VAGTAHARPPILLIGRPVTYRSSSLIARPPGRNFTVPN
jgi:hypothetical protein